MPRKATGRPNGRPKKKRWVEDYGACGPAPRDPIAAMEWGFQVLMVSLSKTIADPDMAERERTASIRHHLRTAKDMIPKSKLAELQRRLDEFEAAQRAPTRPDEEPAEVAASSEPEADETEL